MADVWWGAMMSVVMLTPLFILPALTTVMPAVSIVGNGSMITLPLYFVLGFSSFL
jgi:hypothetical protein